MLTLSNGTIIQLAKELGKGGEGTVYEIQSPSYLSNYVAKIFNKIPSTEKVQKLNYLINNKPQTEENGHTFLIWPLDLIYENGAMVGFIMQKAEGEELELFCDDSFLSYNGPQNNTPLYKGTVWEKFAFVQPNFVITKLKIAYNICAAVAAVHARNCYVLVDLKPVNIKIKENGLISIIDIDSIQVAEKGKVLFGSNVKTPEYSPP
ncbi:MAG: hypothetical protein NZ108_00465, partial [Bacteroidia bacterium]|nr:hypothetical protein [Bacteroidia bacterium]